METQNPIALETPAIPADMAVDPESTILAEQGDDPALKATEQSQDRQYVPLDLLRVSDAINRLADGMWGGCVQPYPLRTLKKKDYKLSAGFGPWRESAAEQFTKDALKGNLPVYVFHLQGLPEGWDLPALVATTFEPAVVPTSVLNRLILRHKALPDHAFQPTIKTVEGNERLLALLIVGRLVVRESEFNAWYEAERAKGKWASQKGRLKPKTGRPTKQTELLRNAVLALVHDRVWSLVDGIAKLHQILVESGRAEVPSADTLERLVARLRIETGETALLR